MEKDNRLKAFEMIINNYNARDKWFIKNSEMTAELRKLADFNGQDKMPQYVTNVFSRYERNGMAMKSWEKATYFAFIQKRYIPIDDYKFQLDKLSKGYKIEERIIETFNKLNTITDKDKLMDMYSKESLFSTRIENGTLTEDNLEFRKEDIGNPEIIEWENIKNAYEHFVNAKINDDLGDLLLIEIHKRLLKGLTGSNRIGKNVIPGEYTNKQNFITGGYLPCLLDEKLKELQKFFKFFNEKPASQTDALIRVAYVSYWFAGIHIFPDGNSRTGRFLISYFMFKHGYNKKMNFSISRALDGTYGRKNAFLRAQAETWSTSDVTHYIEWFIDELLEVSWTSSMKRLFKEIDKK